jgi:thiamine kinase-like enzyme
MINEVNRILNKAWLENALHISGLISDNDRVLSYEIRPLALVDFQVARTFILSMEIEGEKIDAPKSLVLKFAKKQKEYHFFTHLGPQMKMPQLMICPYAELIDDGNTAVLLLEDLSESHTQPKWPLPPNEQDCLYAVRCLAQFHAHWWNHTELPDLLERSKACTYWLQRIEVALESLPAFMDFLGDRLSANRKSIFGQILSSPNRVWLPEQAIHGRTLLHGDAHFWNFLFDPQGEEEKIKLFDWNSWNVGRATDDLAYMVGLHWYAERKQLLEEKMLRAYHLQLTELAVSYSWDTLLEDYRLSTVVSLLIPVWQWQHGINAAVWWGHLERGFQAFDQWNCIDFFE